MVSSKWHLAASGSRARDWFATTHWTVIRSAGENNSAQAVEALEKVCRTYWPPVQSFVRRQGYNEQDAQDLAQSFFAKLLEKNFWRRADPKKGRFRSFLLTALRQYLADDRDRARTAKRGGGVPTISLDEQSSDGKPIELLEANVPNDQHFDREWAMAVLEQARSKLRQECVDSGKSAFFERVDLLGLNHQKSMTYGELAPQLGMSISALKSAVSRLRERYAELVREEIAQTVSSPEELDNEISYLLSIL